MHASLMIIYDVIVPDTTSLWAVSVSAVFHHLHSSSRSQKSAECQRWTTAAYLCITFHQTATSDNVAAQFVTHSCRKLSGAMDNFTTYR